MFFSKWFVNYICTCSYGLNLLYIIHVHVYVCPCTCTYSFLNSQCYTNSNFSFICTIIIYTKTLFSVCLIFIRFCSFSFHSTTCSSWEFHHYSCQFYSIETTMGSPPRGTQEWYYYKLHPFMWRNDQWWISSCNISWLSSDCEQ